MERITDAETTAVPLEEIAPAVLATSTPPPKNAAELMAEAAAARQYELQEFRQEMAALCARFGVDLVAVTWQDSRGNCGGEVRILDTRGSS